MFFFLADNQISKAGVVFVYLGCPGKKRVGMLAVRIEIKTDLPQGKFNCLFRFKINKVLYNNYLDQNVERTRVLHLHFFLWPGWPCWPLVQVRVFLREKLWPPWPPDFTHLLAKVSLLLSPGTRVPEFSRGRWLGWSAWLSSRSLFFCFIAAILSESCSPSFSYPIGVKLQTFFVTFLCILNHNTNFLFFAVWVSVPGQLLLRVSVPGKLLLRVSVPDQVLLKVRVPG